MLPLTHILLGMAAAGVVAGPQRPLALVAGAVAGVLPDAIDWWARQLFRQPDITVTPDPLAPDPATVALGVRLALQRVRIRRCPCVVRFNPLPDSNGGFTAYHLDCNRQHCLVVALESGNKTAPVDLPGADGTSAAIFTPLHPLPLRVTDKPVVLRLRAVGRRIESRDLDQVTDIGHSLPMTGAVALLAFVCSFWTGVAVTTALSMHLLLEIGGRRDVALWLPFSEKVRRGQRLWNERGGRANLCAGALASAVIVALLCAGR